MQALAVSCVLLTGGGGDLASILYFFLLRYLNTIDRILSDMFQNSTGGLTLFTVDIKNCLESF